MIVVNCYGKEYAGNPVGDSFPVNSYCGTVAQVLDCVRGVLLNSRSGIARIEIIVDPEHENARIGQFVQELRSGPS